MKNGFLIALLPLIMLCGCVEDKTIIQTGKVSSVWKHNVGNYSVSYKEGNEIKDKDFHFPTDELWLTYVKFHIIEDVEPNNPMWYLAKYKITPMKDFAEVWIHVRSGKDIRGADWDNGKFGSGRTEKVYEYNP